MGARAPTGLSYKYPKEVHLATIYPRVSLSASSSAPFSRERCSVTQAGHSGLWQASVTSLAACLPFPLTCPLKSNCSKPSSWEISHLSFIYKMKTRIPVLMEGLRQSSKGDNWVIGYSRQSLGILPCPPHKAKLLCFVKEKEEERAQQSWNGTKWGPGRRHSLVLCPSPCSPREKDSCHCVVGPLALEAAIGSPFSLQPYPCFAYGSCTSPRVSPSGPEREEQKVHAS